LSTDCNVLHFIVVKTLEGIKELKMLHQLNETLVWKLEIQSIITFEIENGDIKVELPNNGCLPPLGEVLG